MKPISDSIQTNSYSSKDQQFGDLYFSLRSRENRIYSDEELSLLPVTARSHRYHQEWRFRNLSSCRLLSYLEKKQRPLHILEIGCGNGWLSAQMSRIPDASVTGWDVHQPELKQAERVFGSIQNLKFEQRNFETSASSDNKYDVLVF